MRDHLLYVPSIIYGNTKYTKHLLQFIKIKSFKIDLTQSPVASCSSTNKLKQPIFAPPPFFFKLHI